MTDKKCTLNEVRPEQGINDIVIGQMCDNGYSYAQYQWMFYQAWLLFSEILTIDSKTADIFQMVYNISGAFHPIFSDDDLNRVFDTVKRYAVSTGASDDDIIKGMLLFTLCSQSVINISYQNSTSKFLDTISREELEEWLSDALIVAPKVDDSAQLDSVAHNSHYDKGNLN
jgi:hypothetical protein